MLNKINSLVNWKSEPYPSDQNDRDELAHIIRSLAEELIEKRPDLVDGLMVSTDALRRSPAKPN